MENITLLRFISFAAVLAFPLVVTAQPVTPTGDELQQSYQTLINDLARANVSLNVQALADKREIEKLRAEKAKPEDKHGP